MLAPMARYTHLPFRQLISELGGVNMLYTEMLNARILCNCNLANDLFCQKGTVKVPTVAQIVGGEPDIIAIAIKRLEPLGFEAFDLNMSCPNGAIMSCGWGAALQNDPKRAFEIASKARDATKRPLFVKLRSWVNHDLEPLLQFCIELQRIGVDGITLHPRQAQDGFKRPPRWLEIKHLKNAINIPVFGNGDVTDQDSATKLAEATGCDAVMIGRAALVRPWLFWEITNKRKWQGSSLELLERMAYLMESYFADKTYALKVFKAFLSWFLRNWQFHRYFYGKIVNHQDFSEIISSLIPQLQNAPMMDNISLAKI